MATAVRSTALRAGGACVRCRKGKTKCVYENGRAPCKNCAKGFHECYLPSESMSHGGHGVSPARVQQRVRESLPSDRAVSSTAMDRQAPPASGVSRHVSVTTEKYVFAYLFIFHRFLLFSGPFFFFGPLRMVPWLPTRTHQKMAPFFPPGRHFLKTANLHFRVSVLSLRGLGPTFAQHHPAIQWHRAPIITVDRFASGGHEGVDGIVGDSNLPSSNSLCLVNKCLTATYILFYLFFGSFIASHRTSVSFIYYSFIYPIL